MACPANQRDEDGNLEDPITYAPLDPNRHLQVGQLCYSPESLADWILETKRLEDPYRNPLTRRESLDLLHLLDSPLYPRYDKIVKLVARNEDIKLTYLIYLSSNETPESMTHYKTLKAALDQADLLTRGDRKPRDIAVYPITDDLLYSSPLHYFL